MPPATVASSASVSNGLGLITLTRRAAPMSAKTIQMPRHAELNPFPANWATLGDAAHRAERLATVAEWAVAGYRLQMEGVDPEGEEVCHDLDTLHAFMDEVRAAVEEVAQLHREAEASGHAGAT
jgi:hypothetical protein